MRNLVIIGCGGSGREVADLVRAINRVEPTWTLLGFADDDPSANDRKRVVARGEALLGSVFESAHDIGQVDYVVGIGSGEVRAKLAARADAAGWTPVSLVHPAASVGSQVEIGAGSVVCAGVVINTNVRLGEHVQVNVNCNVGHDSVLESFVTLNPLVAVSGNCHIRSGSTLGSHATVLPGVHIGTDAVVGAAACVVRDVLNGTTVKGVPAR